MEVHRQSPVAITRSVYPLTPTQQQTVQVPLASTPPNQCALILTPIIRSRRKVISCRPPGYGSEHTHFDALLESYDEWLALHPCPLSPQSTPPPSHSPSMQESCSCAQSHSRLVAGSLSPLFPVGRVSGSKLSPNTSHVSSPHSQSISQHTTTCKEHPSGVLTQEDAATPGQLVPIRLEDLFSDDEHSICSVTYNHHLSINAPNVVTNFSQSQHTRDNVSLSLLKPPIKDAVLLADRFYHRHLLCLGMKGLVHGVLNGKKQKRVATAHGHWRQTNIWNGWRRCQLKTGKERFIPYTCH